MGGALIRTPEGLIVDSETGLVVGVDFDYTPPFYSDGDGRSYVPYAPVREEFVLPRHVSLALSILRELYSKGAISFEEYLRAEAEAKKWRSSKANGTSVENIALCIAAAALRSAVGSAETLEKVYGARRVRAALKLLPSMRQTA